MDAGEGGVAWSGRLQTIVAKTDRESDWTLSLPAHLEDAGQVAGLLWDEFLSPAVKSFIATEAGGDEAGRHLVLFLASTHDLGKASNAFQKSLPPLATHSLADHGLRVTSDERRVPHGTLGQVELKAWLIARVGGGPGASDLAEVIGGHHGLNPSSADLQDARRYLLLEDPSWHDARVEVLEGMTATTGAEAHLADWVDSGFSLPVRVLVQAVVILADWIASNTDYFPYQDDRSSKQRARDALTALAFPPPWSPQGAHSDPATLFEQRFPGLRGARPNSVQEAACRLAGEAAGPGLLLIEARPGLGKTEAGLLAAEVMAARFGLGGLFVGLPTMATANPMFARVASWLSTMTDATNSLNLAHSKSALSEDFGAIIRASHGYAVHGDSVPVAEWVRVVAWLRGRKRSLLSNIVVGTVDQFLMGALRAKHVVLRHLALAGKVVLIDEIHAADDYMREYALAMLHWLGRYRAPVILMSATLPPEQRRQYLAAYAAGRGVELPELEETPAYPRLTLFDGRVTTLNLEPEDTPVSVTLECREDDADQLVRLLEDALLAGGCAAVICNTVGRAQDTFKRLREVFGQEVVLLHSRFIAPHRLAREKWLTDRLGRNGDRPHRLIVVGTQVLEQSLDVDFDLMITDLAPIDLVLQRAGRLHRHLRSYRPALVREPRLILTGAQWDAAPPDPVGGSMRVYGKAKLLRAAAVLQPHFAEGHLELPTDIPRLVTAGYDPALNAPEGWEREWADAATSEAKRIADARDRAQTYSLEPPADGGSMDDWLRAPADDPESPRNLGRAQVRDGGDSIEVIVLQRDFDGVLRLPEGDGPMAGMLVPEYLPIDDRLAKAMAATTLTLPLTMCLPAEIDRTIDALERTVAYDTWQSSHWLQGQLALVLDAEGSVRVAEFQCTYSDDLGLTAIKVKDNA